MVTLNEAKLYLRIDSDVEDSLITNLIAASESYLKDAVNDYDKYKTEPTFADKVKLAQLAIITEMYQDRDNSDTVNKDYSYAIRSLITQMQYWSKDDDNNQQNAPQTDNT